MNSPMSDFITLADPIITWSEIQPARIRCNEMLASLEANLDFWRENLASADRIEIAAHELHEARLIGSETMSRIEADTIKAYELYTMAYDRLEAYRNQEPDDDWEEPLDELPY